MSHEIQDEGNNSKRSQLIPNLTQCKKMSSNKAYEASVSALSDALSNANAIPIC